MNGGHVTRFWTLLQRSCRLRCPACGKGPLFRNWFQMHTACDHCGAKFEREGGFFLGSIYLNYGLTALVTAVFYPLCLFNRILDKTTLMVVCVLFAVLFPLWFFRYARSLWLGFDHFADPPSTASEPTSNHPPSRKHLDPEFPAGDSESE